MGIGNKMKSKAERKEIICNCGHSKIGHSAYSPYWCFYAGCKCKRFKKLRK